MADPKVLYAVVSVVFAGLMVWLAFVFRTAKEPWAVAPVAAPPAAAKPEAKPAVAEEDDEDEDEDEEDEDAEGEKVTVKNEVATEEAIEKAKKTV